MLWSILTCAIPERFHTAQELLFSLLETQSVARMPDVEFLYLLDNRRRSVGAKRNALMAMATGEYISFIDDDDLVANNYVQKLHAAIVKARKANRVVACEGSGHDITDPDPVDVICFPQRATLSPANVIHECTYSLAHYHQRKPEDRRKLAASDKPNVLGWSGPPSHTMVWRREVVKDIRFPEKNFGEDVEFVDQACQAAKTEVVLNGSPLYFYNFNEATTATR